jgi:hypothetical protein
MTLPISGNAEEKNRFWNHTRTGMLLDNGIEFCAGFGKTETIEECLPLAKFQMRQEIITRDKSDDPMVFPSSRIKHQQCRGPGNVEQLHEFGPVFPETLALERDELILDILLHLFFRIRTRIHSNATKSAIEPEIVKYRFVTFPGHLYCSLKICFPSDLGHVSSPFP